MQMEQTEIKRKKTRVLLLIMLVILLSLVFIKLLMHKMNRYIDENGKSSMGAVVEQIQQTYDLQVNRYYSQLHLVEDYLLQEKELSLETDTHKKIFEAWEKESESTLLFLQENGKAITVDGKKIRIDIPSKLLLDLRNGHNIAKLVDWNHEETQSGGYLAAIPCPEYRIDGETYTAIGTVYDHAKLDSMLKLKGYNGNAYLFMLDNEGNITYTNQSEDIFFRNYSLLKHLKKAQTITENEAAFLRKKIEEKEAGVLLLGKASRYYLGYAPIESNNTTLICIVPKGIVDNVLRDYQKTVWFATVLMVSFIFLLWIGLTWSVFKLSIADQKAEYEKRNNELQLQTMKKMEEANKKLKKAKNIATEALQTAENANKAKTDFLSNMSHDIRTPMNAIIGLTALAAAHMDQPDLVKDYLTKISTSSQHLLSLINDVLDMSRIESGVVKIEEKEVCIPDILHDLKTIIQGNIQAKQQDLYIDTQDVVHENVITDRLRLNQILLNIVSNAIKFTPVGGMVNIRVSEKPCNRKGSTTFEFRIRDNGIGMSEEFQAHVFDSFSRERSSTQSGIIGTGLGMAITRNIVDMMGGTISLTSKEDKGTEFVVSLNFKTLDKATVYGPIPELVGARALVVDDDVHTCMSVSKMLREIEMRADWSTSGKEAVIRAQEAFEENDAFKAYIIDWLMPDMNGIETVRRIRAVVGDETPIIILTAYDWADIEQEAKEAGVTAFVEKPIFMSELRRVLTKPMEIKEETSQQTERENRYSGKKVLLVEDNELNREIATALLEEIGIIVDSVEDGTDAVERMNEVEDDRYDLIFMDIQMPKMDGYMTTREIRTLKNNKKANIPIVAMTANAFEEDKKKAFKAGMNAHVAKPIDIKTILSVFDQVFGRI